MSACTKWIVPGVQIRKRRVDRTAQVHGDDASAVVEDDFREAPEPATSVEDHLALEGLDREVQEVLNSGSRIEPREAVEVGRAEPFHSRAKASA